MGPHVIRGQLRATLAILVVFLDCVVGEVNGLVEVVERVLLGTEAEVAVLVEPESEGIPVRDQEPLTDIKLSVVDE